MGFSDTVGQAVDAITRRPGEGDAYYQRVAANDAARAVKLADLWDNTHPDRVRLLTPEDADWLRRKYQHALELRDPLQREEDASRAWKLHRHHPHFSR